MAENKVNWNTILVVLVIGVVGILLLNNLGVLTGNVAVKATTGTLVPSDKQVILDTLNKCTLAITVTSTCDTFCNNIGKTCVVGEFVSDGVNDAHLIDCDQSSSNFKQCFCCSP